MKHCCSGKQSGAALIVALVSLFMVTVLGVVSLKSAGLSERTVDNYEEKRQMTNVVEGALNQFFVIGNPNGLQTTHQWNSGADLNTDVEIGDGTKTVTVNRVANFIAEATGGQCPQQSGRALNNESGSSSCFLFSLTGAVEAGRDGATAGAQMGSGFWAQNN